MGVVHVSHAHAHAHGLSSVGSTSRTHTDTFWAHTLTTFVLVRCRFSVLSQVTTRLRKDLRTCEMLRARVKPLHSRHVRHPTN
ncbi:uncharacterized protein G2W53_042628 [Senna tora]|uniref:Uncharacterized protein n=1 Tax=Senna tora TaxID=362788 RepID=A0A834SHA5_9FABA|nr:uncharacterized protein G2W53_042628 [Senna tora]